MTLTTPNHAERWVDIKGYEGMYQVSDLGRVRSLRRDYRTEDKILKPRPDKRAITALRFARTQSVKTGRFINWYLKRLSARSPTGLLRATGMTRRTITG